MLRIVITLFLFFFLSSISFGEQNTDKKIKTPEELRKIFEKIIKNKENLPKGFKPKNYQRTPEDQFKKILRDLKPFLVFIFIIAVVAATRSGKGEFKKEEEQLDNSSDSTLQRAIKRFKKKKKKEEDDWKADKVPYEDEDDSDDWLSDQEPLKIKVEKEKAENILSYVVKGKGGIFIDNKLLKKDDNKAKFSVYVFDVTDPKNKIPLTSRDRKSVV